MAALARELARRHTVTVLTSRALGLAAESNEGGVRIVRAPVFFRRELAVANFPRASSKYRVTPLTETVVLMPVFIGPRVYFAPV